ncbi:MAG: Gldg family protein [Gemmatimonadota bacterium]
MMRAAWTVARREVRSYFDQPTAYVLIVAFLGISLFLTFRNLYATGAASLRPLFDLLPILFAVFIPAVTMRSLAEEQRSHTLEWLMAQPVNEAEVVLGKFLGDWIFVLIALAGTLPTGLGVLLASEADPGIMVAQYMGAAVLAAQLVAVGLWASSVTRNQITAFILGAVVSFVLFLMGLAVVQIGLPPALSGALARLSVVSHFQNVARGVIDLRDVLYFVSAAAFFLMLAASSVAGARLSPALPERRRLRIATLLVAVIVVTLNLLGSHIRGRLDLTRDDLYTLSEGSRELLGNLNDIVEITLFASKELPPEIQIQLRDVRDLLADMKSAANGNLRVREVDPDRDEDARSQASAFGISPVEFNVLRDDEFQVRRGYYGLAVTYADDREVIPVISRTEDLEFRLASAIARMTATDRPTVEFASDGAGKAPGQIPGLSDALGDRYLLQTVNLADDSLASFDPENTRVLVVAGPSQPLDSVATKRVREYLQAGGAALLLLDPVEVSPRAPSPVPVRTGLESLVEEAGIRMDGSLVMDLVSSERVSLGRQGLFNVIAPYPLWPIALPAGDHPVTRGLRALSLGWAGALEILDTVHVTPLWQTSEGGALRSPTLPIFPDQKWDVPQEDLGVQVVAAAVDPGLEGEDGAAGEAADSTATPLKGRMVVVGDATFLENQFVRSNPQNVSFVANAIDWLAQDESLIRIRSKNRTPPQLVFTSELAKNVMKWGNLIGVPLLFVLVGIVRITGRRRRAQARWKEVVA